MKFLKDDEFASLKAKADNYDSIVNAVVAGNDSLTAEDVTPEVIQAAIENVGDNADETLSSQITDLQTEIQTLTETVSTLTTERDTLQTENAELRELPGTESVTTAKPATEASAAETDTVLEFANKNKGNVLAIAAEMTKAGLV